MPGASRKTWFSASMLFENVTAARRVVHVHAGGPPVQVPGVIGSSVPVTLNWSAAAGAAKKSNAAAASSGVRRANMSLPTLTAGRCAGQPPIGQAIMRGMDVDALLDDWERAWSGRDARAFEDVCAADVHYEDPLTPEPLIGTKQLGRHARQLWEAFPDARVNATGQSLAAGPFLGAPGGPSPWAVWGPPQPTPGAPEGAGSARSPRRTTSRRRARGSAPSCANPGS